MSQQLPPTGGPSEEEVRQYVAQMRGLPAEQIVAELLQELINAAQMKLGRHDGRLLLDLCAVVIDHTRPYVAAELAGQVDNALTQLRVAQVDAEREVTAAATEGHVEPNDLPQRPHAPGTAAPQPASDASSAERPAAPPADSPVNKLWLPGR